MGKPNKHRLAALALIAVASLLLAACDSTPPAPNQQQNTPTPLPPPRSAEDVIARAKQVFAAETAHSYVISETDTFTRSAEMVNGTPTIYEADALQVDYRAWYQAPNLWRTQTTFVSTVQPTGMFDMGPPPTPTAAPTINVSDGINFWLYYAGTKQALVDPFYGIKPITKPNSRNNNYEQVQGATESTTDLLAYISECYTATMQGKGLIADRAAYVLDLAPRCTSTPDSFWDNPRTIWLDQENYLLLKDVVQFPGLDKAIGVKEVKSISVAFNRPIDAAVFTFKPPADANVIDNRPLPGGLAEARQRASFPIFVPADVPAGLIPEPPDYNSKSGEPIFEAHYFGSDGISYMMITESALGSLPFKQLHPTDEPITLPNGITANYRNGADWCNQIDSFIYWVQDGTIITVSTPSSGGIYGNSALNKDELIKVAASMSKTAALGKIGWPPYLTPILGPSTAYTAPTPCPTPHR